MVSNAADAGFRFVGDPDLEQGTSIILRETFIRSSRIIKKMGDMMGELLIVLFIVFLAVGLLKLLGLFFEVGLVLAVLPFKIIGAVFAVFATLLCIPFIILFPLFVTLLLPLLVIGLGVAGLVYLLK